MSVERTMNPVDIAISGLKAEAMRLKVIANNIANSQTTHTESGQPYRRQKVVLSAPPEGLSGVRIDRVESDLSTAFKRIYQPGPGADADGYVLMPNVELPEEMMQMVLASRAYQANAAVLKRYQEMVDLTLELLR